MTAKRGVAAAIFALAAASSLPAWAADEPEKRVVVVIGPEGDPLGDLLEKELRAMSFEVARSVTPEGCGRVVIAERVTAVKAVAAACSDGVTVDLWVVETSGLRLRDVVAVNAADEHANDVAAVRAAEITRASLSLVDEKPAEPEPEPAKVAPEEPLPIDLRSFERDLPPPPPKPAAKGDRVPFVTMSAGISSLIGIDATVPAVAGAVSARVSRFLEAGLRVDYPLGSERRDSPSLAGQRVLVRPAFFGAVVDVPLLPPAAFAVPRVGAGLGVVWLHTEPDPVSAFSFQPTSFDAQGQPVFATRQVDRNIDVFSGAAFLSGGVSLRVFAPQARAVIDGVLGTTAQRFVVRTAGSDVAYWGQPFATLAVRFEVLIR